MPRRRHRTRRAPSEQAQQTVDQLAALIPSGGVNPRQAHRVEIEQVALGDKGAALVTREVVSTPVRRLFQSGCITQFEVAAAYRFRDDYNSAFQTSRNPLDVVQVDGKGSGAGLHGAMIYRANSAIRYHDVEQALDLDALRILRALVLEETERGGDATFTALGDDMAPSVSERIRRDMARGAAWLALRQLARVYERGKRRLSTLTGGPVRR